jgi:hypothetical protein
LVYSSLRFDDGLHVSPAGLHLRDGHLCGRVWQTKVDRKRKGTVFVVPNVSVGSVPWLHTWFEWSQEQLSMDADFWLPHTDGKLFLDKATPAVFTSSLAALREMLHWHKAAQAGNRLWEAVDPDRITWHSARCTVPSWAGEAGRSSVEILMQMHSSSPEMAAKYQRSRGTIASRMVTELCADLQKTYKRALPVAEPDEDVTGEATLVTKEPVAMEPGYVVVEQEARPPLPSTPPAVAGQASRIRARPPSTSSSSDSSSSASEDEDAALQSSELETPLAFYVLHTVKAGPADKVRYHCPALSNPTVLACRNVEWCNTETFECAGAQPPRGAQVCKMCMAVRPDVAAKVGKWQLESSTPASGTGTVRPKAKSRGSAAPS